MRRCVDTILVTILRTQASLKMPLLYRELLREAVVSSAAKRPVVAIVAPGAGSGGGAGGGSEGGFTVGEYVGESWLIEGRICVAAKGKQRVVVSRFDSPASFKHTVEVSLVCGWPWRHWFT